MVKPYKNLIICVHSHQPVGNFDNVFEEAYQKSYKPFFEAFERHASIPLSCHFSGSLIDWLEKHRPEFIQLLKKMSDRGQIEFVGGGYYEPIYGLIPKKDLQGQISMMSEKIRELFGKKFEGVWLTERVWDPDLVTPLKKAGIQFTILDDLHFEKAGLAAPIKGYYQTKQGKDSLDLFASMKQLRYLMPFRKAEETFHFIHATEAGPQDVFVFADDCEKFGMWPGTYDWVYKEEWLDKFLKLLEKDEVVKACSFKDCRQSFGPKSVVKIPHASYSEMMEWSDGNFYNFMKKYPESRYMRDRMWAVSEAVGSISSSNGSFEKARSAKAALYRAQCNCSYWHGVFGGLYLHHLRSAVFENLIQAEHYLCQIDKKRFKKESALIYPEKLESGQRWKIAQKDLVSFFNGAYGGALEELDTIPKHVNLMCNLQRRKEKYHEVAMKKSSEGTSGSEPLSIHELLGNKESGLEQHLHYDLFRRLSFMDHFFREALIPDEFAKSSYSEAGDFIAASYRAAIHSRKGVKELSFEKTGQVFLDRKKYPVTVNKIISPKGSSALKAHYLITNRGTAVLRCAFGVEFNFSIGDSQAMKGLDQKGIREWIFNDSWRDIRIELHSKEPMDLIAVPVDTVSESESGLEKTYQELGVLLQKNIVLDPKQTLEQVLELSVV